MYMITILQIEAYKVTKEIKYINRAAEEMVLYLDKLQRPNGLFYHALDVPFIGDVEMDGLQLECRSYFNTCLKIIKIVCVLCRVIRK